MKCQNCKVNLPDEILFGTTCDCGQDLHICMNCKFYSESSYNSCKEPMADRVTDKSKNNRCEYFKISDNSINESNKNKALEELSKLFK